jgi:hypothetical protein
MPQKSQLKKCGKRVNKEFPVSVKEMKDHILSVYHRMPEGWRKKNSRTEVGKMERARVCRIYKRLKHKKVALSNARAPSKSARRPASPKKKATKKAVKKAPAKKAADKNNADQIFDALAEERPAASTDYNHFMQCVQKHRGQEPGQGDSDALDPIKPDYLRLYPYLFASSEYGPIRVFVLPDNYILDFVEAESFKKREINASDVELEIHPTPGRAFFPASNVPARGLVTTALPGTGRWKDVIDTMSNAELRYQGMVVASNAANYVCH